MQLKSVDPEQSGFDQLDNEAVYKTVSSIYGEFVQRASGKTVYYLGNKNHKKYQKKVENIRALILICSEFGVTFEVYIKAHFDVLRAWLRKKGMTHPTFPMMVSEKAVDRFAEWEAKHSRKFESKKEARKSLYDNTVDYQKSINRSAEKFYDHLLSNISSLTPEVAMTELEMCSRMGWVTDLYVSSHPMVEKSDVKYLKEIQKKVRERQSVTQIDMLRTIRVDMVAKHGESGVNAYV